MAVFYKNRTKGMQKFEVSKYSCFSKMEDVKFDEGNIINPNEISKCNEVSVLKEDEVESIKSEMKGVREENMRLKTLLQQIENDYNDLKTRFVEVFRHQFDKNSSQNVVVVPTTIINSSAEDLTGGDDQEQELVSLRLGTISAPKNKEDITQHVITSSTSTSNSSKLTSSGNDGELKLGLENNTHDNEKLKNTGKNPGLENYGEKWPPSKVMKTEKNGGDEDVAQTSVKRARVCVRARCDTPTMNDGCQWRKYGQKIAKGNPCPRAYYRCTVSPSCPVRKQVQRCMEDMSILITTYEGTHNHPLHISATTMASTTSAAASMLLSGSSTSQPYATAANHHGSIFPPFDTSRPQPYYTPSSSSPFPTITLDLTTNSTTMHGGFSLFSSGSRSTPRSPATNFSFSSVESNMVPTVWGNGGFSKHGASNYNSDHQFLKPAQEQKMFQPYLEKFNQGSSQQALTETLTKVITSDPSFRSVIAAAISTMAGNGSLTGKMDNDRKET